MCVRKPIFKQLPGQTASIKQNVNRYQRMDLAMHFFLNYTYIWSTFNGKPVPKKIHLKGPLRLFGFILLLTYVQQQQRAVLMLAFCFITKTVCSEKNDLLLKIEHSKTQVLSV